MMRTTIIKAVVAVPVAALLFIGALALSPMGVPAKAQATISAGEAEQAALAAIPGTVVEPTDLQDENGLQLYGVIIQAADGSGKWDVKVDASSGQVVSIEADEPDGENNDGENANKDDGETSDDQLQLAIVTPQNGSALSNKPLTVTASVTNSGKMALRNIPVEFQLDGRKIGTKTMASLKSGQSKKVVFKVKLNALNKISAAAVPMATKLGILKPGVHFLTVLSRPAGSKATVQTSIRLTLTGPKTKAHSLAASNGANAQTPTVAQVQLFTMSGQLVSQETLAASSNVSAQSFAGKTLAKGVYLYVVTIFDQSGLAIKKEVKKLVIH